MKTVEEMALDYAVVNEHCCEVCAGEGFVAGYESAMNQTANPSVINLNDCITVILTEHGKKIWNDFIITYYADDDLRISQDTRVTFQMWELFQVFGPHMGLGSKQVFEKNELHFGNGELVKGL